MYLELSGDELEINKVKKLLTVKPCTPDDYVAKEYKVYESVDNSTVNVPMFFKIKYNLLSKIIMQDGVKCSIKFTKELRDYQVDPANLVYTHLEAKKSGLCCVYTGWGKTCLALWVASKLKVKTLIVVHTGSLLEQWRERIEFFTDCKPGVYRQDCEDSGSNIVVATVQSLLRRKYKLEDFGFLIVDETHMYPTQYFKNIFYKIPTLYTLGLTATLTRKDKLDKVIKWFLGEIIVNIEQLTHQVSVKLEYYSSEHLKEEVFNRIGKLNQSKMLTDLCEDKKRTDFIISIINNCLSENRKILVLSHRRNQCEYMYNILGDKISGLYLGKMTNAELDITNAKSVILATYNMASMGYDNKTLDTLIFASPRSSIKQCVGRIIRQTNINFPLVIDIVDAYSFYNGLFNQRLKYYKSSKFSVSEDIQSQDEETNQSKGTEVCLL